MLQRARAIMLHITDTGPCTDQTLKLENVVGDATEPYSTEKQQYNSERRQFELYFRIFLELLGF